MDDATTRLEIDGDEAAGAVVALFGFLLAELGRVEWSGVGDGFMPCCPSCGGEQALRPGLSRLLQGHAPDCPLAALAPFTWADAGSAPPPAVLTFSRCLDCGAAGWGSGRIDHAADCAYAAALTPADAGSAPPPAGTG